MSGALPPIEPPSRPRVHDLGLTGPQISTLEQRVEEAERIAKVNALPELTQNEFDKVEDRLRLVELENDEYFKAKDRQHDKAIANLEREVGDLTKQNAEEHRLMQDKISELQIRMQNISKLLDPVKFKGMPPQAQLASLNEQLQNLENEVGLLKGV